MATSTLDPDNFPARPSPRTPPGHDLRSLGPSDSSDSGSDSASAGSDLGDLGLDDNSDRFGTGERGAGTDTQVQEGGDIGVDRIVDAVGAGLGGGLDQAEEAILGITDEELLTEEDDTPFKKAPS
jgi:hypothetical protein